MVSNEGKVNNAFFKIFGNKSFEKAKLLLTAALKNEDEPEVKVEIERRLMMLESKQDSQIKWSGCGKLFQPTDKKIQTKLNAKNASRENMATDNNESTLIL